MLNLASARVDGFRHYLEGNPVNYTEGCQCI